MSSNYKDLEPSKVTIELLIKDLEDELNKGNTELFIDGTLFIKEKYGVSIIRTNQPQM
jgi:hypothetical protein